MLDQLHGHSTTDAGGAVACEEPPASPLGNTRISARAGLVFRGLPRLESVAVAVVYPGGLAFKRSMPSGEPPTGVQRGEIRGFSEGSKARLMRRLAAVDWAGQKSYFVSLTYHLEWEDWQEWKRDLRAWLKRLDRRYHDRLLAVLWKLEFQRRGAPHFHLALFWKPSCEPVLSSFRGWASRSWTELVSPGDRDHLAHGCDVQAVRNTSGPEVGRLMRYLSKYLGKTTTMVDPETQEVVPTGRIWGVVGELPTKVLGSAVFGADEWRTYLARVRAWGKGSRFLEGLDVDATGGLIFGDGDELLQLVLECVDDPVKAGQE